jgi:hypothetical protein
MSLVLGVFELDLSFNSMTSTQLVYGVDPNPTSSRRIDKII